MASLLDDRAFRRDFERFALFGLLIPFGLGSSAMIFNDGDVSWHIASGRWILAHGAIPRSDPFSFTAVGRQWVPFEWLSDLIYAVAFNLSGYAGLAAIVSVALVALHLVVLMELRRWASPIQTGLTIVLMDMALIPFQLARPHVLAWPLLAAWLVILVRARERDDSPPLWTAALMALWVNLHGSFAIGLAFAAAFALEAVVASGWNRAVIGRWALFGLLCALAAMLTPNGLDGVLYPLKVSQLKTLRLIQEWRPSTAGVTPWFFAIGSLTVAILLSRGVRLGWLRALLIGLLAMLAFWQMRHQAVLTIFAAVILARPLAERGGAAREAAEPTVTGQRRRWQVAGVLAGAVLGLALVRAAMPLTPTENSANPRRALAAIPARLRDRPVLNDYTLGGPLILAGIRPYIDGRSDMYGDAFFADYRTILDGDQTALDRAVTRWDIRWTMVDPSRTALLARLDHSAGWRRIYADRFAIIHVRTDS